MLEQIPGKSHTFAGAYLGTSYILVEMLKHINIYSISTHQSMSMRILIGIPKTRILISFTISIRKDFGLVLA